MRLRHRLITKKIQIVFGKGEAEAPRFPKIDAFVSKSEPRTQIVQYTQKSEAEKPNHKMCVLRQMIEGGKVSASKGEARQKRPKIPDRQIAQKKAILLNAKLISCKNEGQSDK